MLCVAVSQKQWFSSHPAWLSRSPHACVRGLVDSSGHWPFALRSCPRWMTALSSQEWFFLKAFDALQGVLADRLRRTGLDRGKLRFARYAGPYWRHGFITGTDILRWRLFLGYRFPIVLSLPGLLPSHLSLTFSSAVSIDGSVNSVLCPVVRASVVNRNVEIPLCESQGWP